MQVTKRNGKLENVYFDKITKRIEFLADCLNVNVILIAQKLISKVNDKIKTSTLDELASDICIAMQEYNIDYKILAGRLLIDNHKKNTNNNYLQIVSKLYYNTDIHKNQAPLINKKLFDLVKDNIDTIQAMFDYTRDFDFDYFGFKTLLQSYLLKDSNKKVIERPQHLWMRVALALHDTNFELVKETYDLLSNKFFTHATPTLFNAGTKFANLASCFLLSAGEDSVSTIYKSISDAAIISKHAGGIGIHISDVRANQSYINSTSGYSGGILPLLKVLNATCKHINQAGKRNGSIAVYIEPWHSDILAFLDAKRNHGTEENKARDLFYALWIPDIFMRMIEKDDYWYLMCPNECPGLTDNYGIKFEELYQNYIDKTQYREKINARELWATIINTQIETGSPYILYKDACNYKSNQKNIGIIKSSNLCVAPETLILTDKGHIPIKNLKDQQINVWNGMEFSKSIIKKTSEATELIKVLFSDFSEIECTKYHKFFIKPSYGSTRFITKEAEKLKINDKLAKCNYPVIDSELQLESAYTNGFFTGDGTWTNKVHENKPITLCSFKATKGHNVCKRHLNFL